MTLPSLLFGLICALLIGALFHLWVNGGPGRLVLDLGLSLAGFAVGHWLGASRGWPVLPVGPLDLGLASLGSLLFVGVGHWLSRAGVQRRARSGQV